MVTLFVLLLLVNSYLASTTTNYNNEKTISIFSKQYEKNYEIQVQPFKDVPCKSINSLKLEGLQLSTMNDNLIQSDTLNQISFRENALTSIPATILKHVPNLICLDISRNKFNLNNDNFIEHNNLRVLDISYQKSEFTEGEPKSEVEKNEKHMEIKMFNTNNIYCPNLEHLFLSGNDIASLSKMFSLSFPKLTHLYLNNINATYINLDFFDKIPNTLRSLHLENNKIYNLTLQNMTEISELYLDGNPFENIEIVSKKLKILSLSYGAGIANINLYTPYLEYLDLSHNNLNIKNQPDIRYDNFQFLKTLLLDYNEFSSFPMFDFDLSLTRLSLSYNKLTYITSTYFQHLNSLEMLTLRGNRIKHIESDSFKKLDRLEFLDLSQNYLINLPTDWIIPLKSLQFLNVSSNYFVTISDIAISPLSLLNHLFVEDNTFTSITTKQLDTLPNLITVYLD